jgi:hypothetical protein
MSCLSFQITVLKLPIMYDTLSLFLFLKLYIIMTKRQLYSDTLLKIIVTYIILAQYRPHCVKNFWWLSNPPSHSYPPLTLKEKIRENLNLFMILFQQIKMVGVCIHNLWQHSTPPHTTPPPPPGKLQTGTKLLFLYCSYSVFSLSSGSFPHNYCRDDKTLKNCEWHLDVRITSKHDWNFILSG